MPCAPEAERLALDGEVTLGSPDLTLVEPGLFGSAAEVGGSHRSGRELLPEPGGGTLPWGRCAALSGCLRCGLGGDLYRLAPGVAGCVAARCRSSASSRVTVSGCSQPTHLRGP